MPQISTSDVECGGSATDQEHGGCPWVGGFIKYSKSLQNVLFFFLFRNETALIINSFSPNFARIFSPFLGVSKYEDLVFRPHVQFSQKKYLKMERVYIIFVSETLRRNFRILKQNKNSLPSRNKFNWAEIHVKNSKKIFITHNMNDFL